MRSKPRCFVLTLVLVAVLAPWLAACGSSSDAGSAQ